mmetsp:Transcript_31453/g.46207  ORF Transcript_31453/g.46207 Transcript_31453/m.46207 type:complete len:1110 (+) Transcript_31453:63-3392(+)
MEGLDQSTSDLDFSSFPLLRVDQLKQHKMNTLISSEEKLDALIRTTDEESRDSVVLFASRLIDEIRKEIADRRVQSLLLGQDPEYSTNSGEDRLQQAPIEANEGFIEPSKLYGNTCEPPRSSISMYRSTSAHDTSEHTTKTVHKYYPRSGQAHLVKSTTTKHLRYNNRRSLKPSKTSHTANADTQKTTYSSNQGIIRGKKPSTKKNPAGKNKKSSFLVGVGSQNGESFRGRAKKAADALRNRSFEQSESYKQHQIESQREERKKLATERMKLRCERRQAMEKRREKRALIARKKREMDIEHVRDQMKIAAENAKEQAEISGKSALEAIFDAAAAAAGVAERTSSLKQLSDFSESLSELDDDDLDSLSTKETNVSSVPSTLESANIPLQHDLLDKHKQICGTIRVPKEGLSCVENSAMNKEDASLTKSDGDVLKIDSYDPDVSDEGSLNKKLTSAQVKIISINSNEKHGLLPAEDEFDRHRYANNLSCPSPNKEQNEVEYGPFACFSNSSSNKSSPLLENESISDFLSVDLACQNAQFSLLKCSLVDGQNSNSCDDESHIFSREKSSLDGANKNMTSSAPCNTAISGERYQFSEMYPSFANIFTRFHKCSTSTRTVKGNSSSRVKFTSAEKTFELGECMMVQRKLIPAFLEIIEETIGSNIEKDRFFRVSSSREEVSSILRDALKQGRCASSWEELPSGEGIGASWNLLWTWSRPKLDYDSLVIFQKINHFRNVKGLTRKDLLKKNLQRFCTCASHEAHKGKQLKNVSKLMPLTYVLPQEYNAFVAAFLAMQKIAGNKSSNFWILKPVGLSRGRGISLINNIEDISYADPIVTQKYLLNPLLFLGYKFDLRLYILVTSFNPLEAFIYKQGFGRFGTQKFSVNPESIHDERIHLTNSSIQQQYWDDLDPRHPVVLAGANGGGNKVTLSWLFEKLKVQGFDTRKMWIRISDLCLKTLLCVEDDILHQPNAFEVFGFDVIFDEQLSPWLIEVNSSPSLARETDLDTRIKEDLIYDTVILVNPPAFNRVALFDICQRRCSQQCRDRNGKNLRKHISEKDQLENDLREILANKLPRKYGELPRADLKGSYERLAPGTPSFERMKKAHSSYLDTLT